MRCTRRMEVFFYVRGVIKLNILPNRSTVLGLYNKTFWRQCSFIVVGRTKNTTAETLRFQFTRLMHKLRSCRTCKTRLDRYKCCKGCCHWTGRRPALVQRLWQSQGHKINRSCRSRPMDIDSLRLVKYYATEQQI